MLVVVFGCAVPPKSPNSRALAVEHNFQSWTMKGRMGIQNGYEAWGMSIIWQQQLDQFTIQLIAPLGQGTTTLKGTEQLIYARFPDGKTAVYQNPDQVFTEAIGVVLPLASLRYWIFGRVDDRKPAEVTRNAAGQIEEIVQDGWDISYLSYSEEFGLPSKILVENDAVEVKLIIREWAR